MSRVPIGEIDDLRCRMDLPGEAPFSSEEILDALDGARYLLKMALPAIPEDDGYDSIVCQMVADLRDLSDRMYGYIFDPEDDE